MPVSSVGGCACRDRACNLSEVFCAGRVVEGNGLSIEVYSVGYVVPYTSLECDIPLAVAADIPVKQVAGST